MAKAHRVTVARGFDFTRLAAGKSGRRLVVQTGSAARGVTGGCDEIFSGGALDFSVCLSRERVR
jgi:hypothetical protein